MLFYIFLLRIYSFIHAVSYIPGETENSLVKTLYQNILISHIIQAIAGVLICFFISLQLNKITISNRLLKENTYFQGVFMAILCTIFSSYPCSPELIGLWLFLSAVSQIFKWYNNNNAIPSIFLGGFYIGAASLLHFPYLYYFFFGFVALIIMRSYNLKESLQYVAGFISPYYLTFGFQVWFEVTDIITIHSVIENIKFFIPYANLDWLKSLQILVFVTITIFTLISYPRLSKSNIIPVQKKIDLLYWVMLFSVVFLFCRGAITTEEVFPILPISSIVITSSLLNQKNKLIPELVHAALLIVAIVVQYLPIFIPNAFVG